MLVFVVFIVVIAVAKGVLGAGTRLETSLKIGKAEM
jgi:hypothetical protein